MAEQTTPVDGTKTPSKKEQEQDGEQKEDSFKTCQKFMPSPKTRRQLRMTPARTSILSGGTPFKEAVTSGKKFNSRKKGAKRLNDTAGSNETFIRLEQELLFDHDSLDHKKSSTPKQMIAMRKSSTPRRQIDSPSEPAPSVQSKIKGLQQPEKALSPKKSDTKQASQAKVAIKKKSLSPKKVATRKLPSPKKAINQMPPPPVPRVAVATRSENRKRNVSRYVTPKPCVFRRPVPTSSAKCLSLWNNSRLTRTQSFKSTAELEREYFSSLRSRF